MGAQGTPHQDQEEISELESKIIQQVEYYFGDYNLRRDRFLKEQMKADDGWVPLEVMIRFNRLKILSEDIAVIANALKKSTNKLLEVSVDDMKIRRCVDKPIQEFSADIKTDLDSRTIYTKRFPLTATLDELLQFFKGFGNVESVFMKKKPNKAFKGSVLVTFVTQEEAQNFLKLTNVKYSNLALLKESKSDYSKRKADEYQQRQLLKEKKQQLNAQSKKDSEEAEKQDPEINITKGCILKLTGLLDTSCKEDIYEVFAESQDDIAYLDYSRGKPEAYIRFSQGIAQSILDKYSKKSSEDGEDMDDEKDDTNGKKDDTDDKKDDKDADDDKKDDEDADGDDKDDKDAAGDKKDDKDADGDEKDDKDADGDENDEKMDDKIEAQDEQIVYKTIDINGVNAAATVLEGELEIEYWQKLMKAKADRRRQPHFSRRGKGRFNPRMAGRDRSRQHGKRGHWKVDKSSEQCRSDEVSEPSKKMIKLGNNGHDSD